MARDTRVHSSADLPRLHLHPSEAKHMHLAQWLRLNGHSLQYERVRKTFCSGDRGMLIDRDAAVVYSSLLIRDVHKSQLLTADDSDDN